MCRLRSNGQVWLCVLPMVFGASMEVSAVGKSIYIEEMINEQSRFFCVVARCMHVELVLRVPCDSWKQFDLATH